MFEDNFEKNTDTKYDYGFIVQKMEAFIFQGICLNLIFKLELVASGPTQVFFLPNLITEILGNHVSTKISHNTSEKKIEKLLFSMYKHEYI